MNYVLKKFFENLSVSKVKDRVFKLSIGQIDDRFEFELVFSVDISNVKFNNLFELMDFAEKNKDDIRSLYVNISDLDFEIMSYFIKNFNGDFQYTNSFDTRRNLVVKNPNVSYDDYASEFVYESNILSIFPNESNYKIINKSCDLEQFRIELKKVKDILTVMPKVKNLFYPEININDNEIEFTSSYNFSSNKILVKDDLILIISKDELLMVTIYGINSIANLVNYKDLINNDKFKIEYVINDKLSILFKIYNDNVEIISDYFLYRVSDDNKLKISKIKRDNKNNDLYSFLTSDSIYSIKIVLKIVNNFLSIENSDFLNSEVYSKLLLVKRVFNDYFNNFDDVEEFFVRNDLY